MKDQKSIGPTTSYERWDRAKSIVLESLLKPDSALRMCAHNQDCYEDVLQLRDQVIHHVQAMSNPRKFIED